MQRFATGETLSEDEDRTHLAWVNSLTLSGNMTIVRANGRPLFIAEQLPDPLIFGRDPGQSIIFDTRVRYRLDEIWIPPRVRYRLDQIWIAAIVGQIDDDLRHWY